MKLTDQVTIFPNQSIGGRHGTVVDTGIDLHWPGPGRVYLHPREVAEAVRAAHRLPEVADVLAHEGWVPGDKHAGIVAELAENAQTAEALAAELRGKLDAALATISLVPAAEPAKPKPAAKKKETA